jgi:phosphoglycerate-specific signal transduction histidine kinase
MATRQQEGNAASSSTEPDLEVLLVHELAEAHTALGCYLLAAKQMFEDGPWASEARLNDVIDLSISQSERADNALRQLRDFLRRKRSAKP